MSKPIPPKPLPMRCMRNYVWINEYELVDWYTDAGKLYTRIDLYEGHWGWLRNLFKRDYELKLDESLTRNRMICTEWPR